MKKRGEKEEEKWKWRSKWRKEGEKRRKEEGIRGVCCTHWKQR